MKNLATPLEVVWSPEGHMVYVDGEFAGYVAGDGTGNYSATVDPRNPTSHPDFIQAVGHVYNSARPICPACSGFGCPGKPECKNRR